jgi:uncharacterized membrane protein YqaE (UPF0057 family)
MTIVKIIFAIILPPVAAALQVGLSTHFWINLVLTLLGWLPGTIHALWLIATHQSGGPRGQAIAPSATTKQESYRELVGPRR